ncbi:MAG: porin [Piscinibacter sp.]
MSVRFTFAPFTLAVLVAAPMVAHAQSTVTVYGIIDATVRHAGNAASGGGSVWSVGDGAYTGSRLGFKGTEDLGGGMKAFFSLEQGLDPSTGTLQQTTATPNYGQAAAPSGRAWGRESLVGLSQKELGTLTLGRQYTFAHQLSGRFQPQPNPNQDSLSAFSTHHVSRQDNMAKYTLDLGSFNVGISKTFGEGTNGASWGLAGSYTSGPVDVVAYASNMDSFNGAETRKIRGLGGNYAVTSELKAFVGGMTRSHRVSKQENKVWTVGANYTVGQMVYTISYVQDKQSEVNAGKRTVAYIGADYLLSKRTDIYAEIDNNKLSGAYPLPSFMGTRASATGASVGMRHRF